VLIVGPTVAGRRTCSAFRPQLVASELSAGVSVARPETPGSGVSEGVSVGVGVGVGVAADRGLNASASDASDADSELLGLSAGVPVSTAVRRLTLTLAQSVWAVVVTVVVVEIAVVEIAVVRMLAAEFGLSAGGCRGKTAAVNADREASGGESGEGVGESVGEAVDAGDAELSPENTNCLLEMDVQECGPVVECD
jgi:hypothetical protein